MSDRVAPGRRVIAAAVLLLLAVPGLAVAWSLFDGAPASAQSSRRPPPDPAARTPIGELNLAWTEPGMIGLVGWAKDPDVDRPIDVAVAVDSQLFVRTAGVYNPFLPGSYAQKFRSYLVAVPATPGRHTMCVAALNVGRGQPFRLLGCRVLDVPSADPIGSLDAATVTVEADRVSVSGWALDPETAFPLPVTITVDGVPAARVVASRPRPDVAQVFPASGPLHGFAGEVPASPGPRRVCAVAQSVGRGADATVGCASVLVPDSQPRGNVDSIAVTDGAVRALGWAADPDAGGPTTVTVSAQAVDGIDDPAVVVRSASLLRGDVAAATGLDGRAGFDVSIPVDEAGTWEVCVTAANVGPGRDLALGCRRVVVADRRPVVSVERVSPTTGGVRVIGWAWDPDSASPVTVRVVAGARHESVAASASRPDVAAVVPGAGAARGFDVTVTGLPAGRHAVCVTGEDQPSAVPGIHGDRTPPCGTAVLGAPAVGTTGAGSGPTAVGPTGSLERMDRDGGVSTRLRDGSVLWLFGDSTERDDAGGLRYFVGGTGAWAPWWDVARTYDAVDGAGAGAPYRLATPTPAYPSCPTARPHAVMWPVSATTVPAGPLDRVIVFLSNMCLGGEQDMEFRGMSVGEWYYDPAAPPVHRPVQLQIVNQDLGLPLDRPYGTASVVDDEGRLVLYTCGRPANLFDVAGFGPCRAARVDPASVGDPSSYRYWNGGAWVASAGAAAPMTLPSGASVGWNHPAASFTVTRDDAHGVYVMAYSPWPGFVDRAAVRVAERPEGPWTAPAEVWLPGCDDRVGGATRTCYAATAQPAFSRAGVLGLGYYDQGVLPERTRGAYHVVAVPFEVDLP